MSEYAVCYPNQGSFERSSRHNPRLPQANHGVWSTLLLWGSARQTLDTLSVLHEHPACESSLVFLVKFVNAPGPLWAFSCWFPFCLDSRWSPILYTVPASSPHHPFSHSHLPPSDSVPLFVSAWYRVHPNPTLKARDGEQPHHGMARQHSAARVRVPLSHLVGSGNILCFENGWVKTSLILH